jgi:hypothetical protein
MGLKQQDIQDMLDIQDRIYAARFLGWDKSSKVFRTGKEAARYSG